MTNGQLCFIFIAAIAVVFMYFATLDRFKPRP